MKKLTNACLLILSLSLYSCGGGGGSGSYIKPISPKIKLSVQNRTLEPYYGPSVRNSTLITATLFHGSNGHLYSDLTPGVTFSYTTTDDVDVHFHCLEAGKDDCFKKDAKPNEPYYTPLSSYTTSKLVGARTQIEFVNSGTKAGTVKIRATLPDPLDTKDTLIAETTISISAGSLANYNVGTKQVGGGNLLAPSTHNVMTAFFSDEAGGKPRPDKKNNIIVSIESAPENVKLAGNYFVKGNRLYGEGSELYLSTWFNGEAQFFIVTDNLPGDVRLKTVADRADNNVDNGIQDPVVSYSDYKVTDSQNTGKINFLTDEKDLVLIKDEIYTSETGKLIVFPVYGDIVDYCGVVEGQLPPGLSFSYLNSQACVLSGTPSNTGNYEAVLQVNSVRPNQFDQMRLRINVLGEKDVEIVPSRNLGSVLVGDDYFIEIKTKTKEQDSDAATAVTPSYVKLTEGELPPGLTLKSNIISGKPTADGEFFFTLEVKDAASNRIKFKEFFMKVLKGAIVLNGENGASTVTLPKAYVDKRYDPYTVKATGVSGYEIAFPLTWQLDAGKIPDGLDADFTSVTIDTNFIAGSFTSVGRYVFVISATDTNGIVGRQTYMIDVCQIVVKTRPKTVIDPVTGDETTVDEEYEVEECK